MASEYDLDRLLYEMQGNQRAQPNMGPLPTFARNPINDRLSQNQQAIGLEPIGNMPRGRQVNEVNLYLQELDAKRRASQQNQYESRIHPDDYGNTITAMPPKDKTFMEKLVTPGSWFDRMYDVHGRKQQEFLQGQQNYVRAPQAPADPDEISVATAPMNSPAIDMRPMARTPQQASSTQPTGRTVTQQPAGPMAEAAGAMLGETPQGEAQQVAAQAPQDMGFLSDMAINEVRAPEGVDMLPEDQRGIFLEGQRYGQDGVQSLEQARMRRESRGFLPDIDTTEKDRLQSQGFSGVYGGKPVATDSRGNIIESRTDEKKRLYEQKMQAIERGEIEVPSRKDFNKMINDMVAANVKDQSMRPEEKRWEKDALAYEAALRSGDENLIKSTERAGQDAQLNKKLKAFEEEFRYTRAQRGGDKTAQGQKRLYEQARNAIVANHREEIRMDQQLRLGAQKVENTKNELKLAEQIAFMAGTEQGRTQAQQQAENLRKQQDAQVNKMLLDNGWDQPNITQFTTTMNMIQDMPVGIGADWAAKNTGTEEFTRRIANERVNQPDATTSQIIQQFFLEDMAPQEGDSQEVREEKRLSILFYQAMKKRSAARANLLPNR